MTRRSEIIRSVVWILALWGVIAALLWAVSKSGARGHELFQQPVPPPTLPVSQALQCPPRGYTLDATITRVVDGDTVICQTVIEYRVRLIDCWAPETRGGTLAEKQAGQRSKARLVEIAEGRPVRVHVPATGSLSDMMTFGRILGHVWLMSDGEPDSTSLSERQIAAGLATQEKTQ